MAETAYEQFKACLQVNENIIVNKLGYGAMNVNPRVAFNRLMNLPAQMQFYIELAILHVFIEI